MTQLPLWLAIVLPFAGFAVGLGTEILRHRLQAKREYENRIALQEEARQNRIAIREEERQDRRDEFELAVLKDAYSALTRLARAAWRFHLADRQVAQNTGLKYASGPIGTISGPDLDEEFRVSNAELGTQIELMLNEELRVVVSSARDALMRPSEMYHSEIEDADRAMDAAMSEVGRAHRQLGIRIRELY